MPPVSNAGFGRPLSDGQLRQLQWIVPLRWAHELSRALSVLPIAGARVKVSMAGSMHLAEHWMGFFDGERLVEEALRAAASPLVHTRGLLPLAGCGKRGSALYLVEVVNPELPVWRHDGGELESMGLGLQALWQATEVEPRVQLRRRLPEKSPRRLAKTTGVAPRSAPTASGAACKRTLSLFA
jgi:hypothetical protein